MRQGVAIDHHEIIWLSISTKPSLSAMSWLKFELPAARVRANFSAQSITSPKCDSIGKQYSL
jgi:hypothetical protein